MAEIGKILGVYSGHKLQNLRCCDSFYNKNPPGSLLVLPGHCNRRAVRPLPTEKETEALRTFSSSWSSKQDSFIPLASPS